MNSISELFSCSSPCFPLRNPKTQMMELPLQVMANKANLFWTCFSTFSTFDGRNNVKENVAAVSTIKSNQIKSEILLRVKAFKCSNECTCSIYVYRRTCFAYLSFLQEDNKDVSSLARPIKKWKRALQWMQLFCEQMKTQKWSQNFFFTSEIISQHVLDLIWCENSHTPFSDA